MQDIGMSSAGGTSSVVDDRQRAVVEPCPRGRTRRLLRSAVRERDVLALRRLLADVNLVNVAVSDALSSSALAYAARCGYLEVVEALVDHPGCRVDHVDRARRSALDDAIGAWAAAAAAAAVDGQVRQHDCARRYRIVRRLLAAGTRSLSREALDVVLASALKNAGAAGQHFVRKLVKVKRAEFPLHRHTSYSLLSPNFKGFYLRITHTAHAMCYAFVWRGGLGVGRAIER